MDISQKYIQTFREKFDAMTDQERRAYLDKMGFTYRDDTVIVPYYASWKYQKAAASVKPDHFTVQGVCTASAVDPFNGRVSARRSAPTRLKK